MKRLIVLIGPTGVGKTDLSLKIAKQYNIPIISADSRQIFRGIEIGTAAPTLAEQKEIKHYFIGTKQLTEQYSAGQYEIDVINLLNTLYKENDIAILTGGSMMYIDAVCKGLDDIPSVDNETRTKVHEMHAKYGSEYMQNLLKELDPIYANKVDIQNTKRVLHAIEICLYSGKTYSSFLKNTAKEREFEIIKIGLNRPRPELYERINQRVDIMIEQGLENEAKNVYPLQHLNSLNTVGFKEIFAYWNNKLESKEQAILLIKQNSRHYAKRQLTWFNKDAEIKWFNPDNINEIINYIQQCVE